MRSHIVYGNWVLQFAIAAVVIGLTTHFTEGSIRDALLMADGLAVGMLIVASFDWIMFRRRANEST